MSFGFFAPQPPVDRCLHQRQDPHPEAGYFVCLDCGETVEVDYSPPRGAGDARNVESFYLDDDGVEH